MAIDSRAVTPITFKGISNDHSRLCPQLARMNSLLPYRPFRWNQSGNQENGYFVLLFLGWNNSCQARVRVGVSQYFQARVGVGVP